MQSLRRLCLVLAAALSIMASLPALAGEPGVDEEELRCLAQNMYFEARSEGRAGKIAVAHVTLNRLADARFPDTICGVVCQGGTERFRCQFHWWCDGLSDEPRNAAVWRATLDLARAALAGRTQDPTNGALFFHTRSVEPRWSQTRLQVASIGNHIFYR